MGLYPPPPDASTANKNIGLEPGVLDPTLVAPPATITVKHGEIGAGALIPPANDDVAGYVARVVVFNPQAAVVSPTDPTVLAIKAYRSWILNVSGAVPQLSATILNDVDTGTSPTTAVFNDYFCSSFTWGSDAKLRTAGGNNPPLPPSDFYVFDPTNQNSGFVRVGAMSGHSGNRFYPTITQMGDGSMVVTGGFRGEQETPPGIDVFREIYPFPASGPSGAIEPEMPSGYGSGPTPLYFNQYPRAFSTKTGKLLVAFDMNAGSEANPFVPGTFDYDVGSTTSLQLLWQPSQPHPVFHDWGSAVIMEEATPLGQLPGYSERIFATCGVGGLDLPAMPQATIDEFRYVSPTQGDWDNVATGQFARWMPSAVLLPDGTVMIIGGTSVLYDPNTTPTTYCVPVQAPEIFTPGAAPWDDGTIAKMNSHVMHRMDHQVALLLPDGRVFTIGSLDNESTANPTPVEPGSENTDRPGDAAEAFSPPYLFKGPRPQITQVQTDPGNVWSYGSAYTVTVSCTHDLTGLDAVRVALMRPGTSTHNFDFDQRYVRLRVNGVSSPSAGVYSISVSAPFGGGLQGAAPPGWYMLFVLDATQGAGNHVPSVASWVRVS